ncbi:hypothetical protein [Caldicellulosiruptor morganii]|uniref:Type 4 fimbrial biogenesis protein PilX N-terminal domain-containing protein n=1 Tax=Caldicellulosiruptor morganii TaxID=1387555 RepID=A0ABY7BK29_9FIRM|nr:hypothetical protein [Caldicellulosiruptor morganii]WAM33192.1 hypothetical protein OTK00_001671 [Caldicellulosiruptor morganii]
MKRRNNKLFVNRGSALIIVIILISILFVMVLGSMSAVVASLNRSVSIFQKTTTAYASQSGTEKTLFYLNQLLEEIKRSVLKYYFDDNMVISANIGELSPSDVMYEPKTIRTALYGSPPSITYDQAKERIKQGMTKYVTKKLLEFLGFSNGTGVSFNVDNSGIIVSSFSQLKDYLKADFESRLSDFSLEDIKIDYDSSSNMFILRTIAREKGKNTKRVERVEFKIPEIDPTNFVNLATVNTTTPVSTPNPFDIFDYAMFSYGNINANKHLTVVGGNIGTAKDLTVGEACYLDVTNIIVLGNTIFNTNQSSPSTVKASGIFYTKGNFRANSGGITLDANILAVDDQNEGIIWDAGSKMTVKEIYAKKVQVSGAGTQIRIDSKGCIDNLTISDGATVILGPGAELYCQNLTAQNQNVNLYIENGAKLYAKNITWGGSGSSAANRSFFGGYRSGNTTVASGEFYSENLNMTGNNYVTLGVFTGQSLSMNFNSGLLNTLDVPTSDRIKYRSILPALSSFPSSIRSKFQNDSGLSYSYTSLSAPAIVDDVRSILTFWQDSILSKKDEIRNIVGGDWSKFHAEQVVAGPPAEYKWYATAQINDNDFYDSSRIPPLQSGDSLVLMTTQGIDMSPSGNIIRNGVFISLAEDTGFNVNSTGNLKIIWDRPSEQTINEITNDLNLPIVPTPTPVPTANITTGTTNNFQIINRRMSIE